VQSFTQHLVLQIQRCLWSNSMNVTDVMHCRFEPCSADIVQRFVELSCDISGKRRLLASARRVCASDGLRADIVSWFYLGIGTFVFTIWRGLAGYCFYYSILRNVCKIRCRHSKYELHCWCKLFWLVSNWNSVFTCASTSCVIISAVMYAFTALVPRLLTYYHNISKM